MATPSPTTFDSANRNVFMSPVSPKRRLPLPRMTGKTIRLSWSTRSFAISVCTSLALPLTRMSPLTRCLSLLTSSTTLPLRIVELFHSAFSSFEETTYFGMLLNLSENGSPVLAGQAEANPSYVTRPSSCASALSVSSILNLSPSLPRLNLKVQAPCLECSLPPGSSITPSRETNSVTTIRPILTLLALSKSPYIETSNQRKPNRYRGNGLGTFLAVWRLEHREATAGPHRGVANGLRNEPGPAKPWWPGAGAGQAHRRAAR